MSKNSRRSKSKESNGNLPNMEQKRRSGRNSKQTSKQHKNTKEVKDLQNNPKKSKETPRSDLQLESMLYTRKGEENCQSLDTIVEEEEETTKDIENPSQTNKNSPLPPSSHSKQINNPDNSQSPSNPNYRKSLKTTNSYIPTNPFLPIYNKTLSDPYKEEVTQIKKEKKRRTIKLRHNPLRIVYFVIW